MENQNPQMPQNPPQINIELQNPPQKKIRRVGTLTLGITLILLGIFIPFALIYKEHALQILQFSPIILILLGGEILFFAFHSKNEKLKYDGLSIFLVIAITIMTILTSTIAPAVYNYMKWDNSQYTFCNTFENDIEKDLSDKKIVASVVANVYYQLRNHFVNEEFDEKMCEFTLHIDTDNPIKYEEIPQQISEIIKTVNSSGKNINHLTANISYKNKDGVVKQINSNFNNTQFNLTLEQIKQRLPEEEIDEVSSDTVSSNDVSSDENA